MSITFALDVYGTLIDPFRIAIEFADLPATVCQCRPLGCIDPDNAEIKYGRRPMTEGNSDNLRVDIISDVVCPWCIIGYSQLKQAADATGTTLDVHWHPYELNPHMPAEGQNLREHISEKYGASAEDSAKIRATLTQMGHELGIAFDFKPESRIVNTFQAHQLIHWAESKGSQHDMKMELIRRYFTEGQDVSTKEVLLEAVRDLGLDMDEAETILNDGQFSDIVRKQEQLWLSKGIQGVPSMVFNKRHLVTGAQGIENYTQIILQLTETETA